MVQSLGRGFDQGAVTNEDSQAHGGARVGTKVASSKLNIANTIASNVDTINAAKIERVQVTDPMFHRMSKAFDEGGAKGMLMNNLVSSLRLEDMNTYESQFEIYFETFRYFQPTASVFHGLHVIFLLAKGVRF